MGKTVTRAPGAVRYTAGQLASLQRLADVLAYSPDLVDLLGSDVDARVYVSDSGRGLVFEFEPVQGDGSDF